MSTATVDLRDAVSAAYESVRDDARRHLAIVGRVACEDAAVGMPPSLTGDFATAAYAAWLEAEALRAEWYALVDAVRAERVTA